MKLFANEDNPLQPGVAFKGYGKGVWKSNIKKPLPMYTKKFLHICLTGSS